MSANTALMTLWLVLFLASVEETVGSALAEGSYILSPSRLLFNLFDSSNKDEEGGNLRGRKKATQLCICKCKESGLCPEKEELCINACFSGNKQSANKQSAKKSNGKHTLKNTKPIRKKKKTAKNKKKSSGNIFSDDANDNNIIKPSPIQDEWYVDYSLGTQGQCVKSCIPSKGPFCGGVHAFWEVDELYGSAEECCQQRLWWMPQEQCVPRHHTSDVSIVAHDDMGSSDDSDDHVASFSTSS